MTLAISTHPTPGAMTRPRSRRPAALRKVLGGIATMTALALLGAPAASAQEEHIVPRRLSEWRESLTWADGRLVDVQVHVDGEPAPLYFAKGRSDRRYLQAFQGRNYSVVLRNNTGNRVAVLLAVDGLNAVSGDRTSLGSHEPMYVLGPWEQATIRGWRTSLSQIRRFVFVDEQRSYAERTGQANSDMGWIRVLAFREQRTWWESRENRWGRVRGNYRDGGSSAPAPHEAAPRSGLDSKDEAVPFTSPAPESRSKAVAPEAQDNLARGESDSRSFPGTGWGERREDRVRRVRFDPEPVATDHLVFRYEYASGLRALGIRPVRGPWRDRLGERDGDLGFAKPPRW